MNLANGFPRPMNLYAGAISFKDQPRREVKLTVTFIIRPLLRVRMQTVSEWRALAANHMTIFSQSERH